MELLSEIDLPILRKLDLLRHWELFVTRPGLLTWSPKELEDLVQLVLFTLAGKQWRHASQLSKDAADRPRVDVRRILPLPQQELRGPGGQFTRKKLS